MGTLRNETDQANLVERLNKLSGGETALWGKMNVNQMVSHLVQSCEMAFDHEVADKGNFFTKTILKPLVLYVLPIPKEVRTSPEVNQQENGRKPLEFGDDKKSVINLIEKLANLPADHECCPHPVFGKMNAKQMGLLAHKHIDHHLRQFGS